jgi:hypothetical protein
MNKAAFYAVLVVLVLSIVYVFKTSNNPPDPGMTHTPRQYIEQLERSRADRRPGNLADGAPDVSAEAEEGSGQPEGEAQR